MEAHDTAAQVREDILAERTRHQQPQPQTATAQGCKPISGRRRRSPEERLLQLQSRAAQLEAQLRTKRRKADTREKIILGGWVKALCRADADRARILDYLGRYAASRKIEVPKAIREDVETAMRQAAAAKAAPKQ